MTIAGVHVDIGHEAVVVRADEPLTTASSAVVGGGLGRAAAIVNLHVPQNFRGEDARRVLEAFGARRAIPTPRVGLLTGARAGKGEGAPGTIDGITAAAVITAG